MNLTKSEQADIADNTTLSKRWASDDCIFG